jgi:hypothetical protein
MVFLVCNRASTCLLKPCRGDFLQHRPNFTEKIKRTGDHDHIIGSGFIDERS